MHTIPSSERGRANGADTPAEDRAPLRHAVVDALRELIIGRVLGPGDHLVETDLAERLDVSRGPIREALQSLHAEGWVELRPRKGAFVRRPSETEVSEIFVIRRALEAEATRLATRRMTAEYVRELREICAVGRTAVAQCDVGAVVEANSAFHLHIAENSGVRLLRERIESLNQRVRWAYKPLVRHRGFDSWEEHEAIVDAMETGAADLAAQLMRFHSDRTGDAFRQYEGE
jgi:DNA-binding GntR family transcriptional regulator